MTRKHTLTFDDKMIEQLKSQDFRIHYDEYDNSVWVGPIGEPPPILKYADIDNALLCPKCGFIFSIPKEAKDE